MGRTIRTLKDVVDWGLCTGCGACASACPKGGVTMRDIPGEGIRPQFNDESCGSCRDCLSICPGVQLTDLAAARHGTEEPATATHEFGPVLEIYEGHAGDPAIRHAASSGGILTALALFCLEEEGMQFVLHAGMDEQRPWLNQTRRSRSREELLACAGSRYAPSSPCEHLDWIEQAAGPCVFIGKPCDAAAAGMLCHQRPGLDRNMGLILTFFCAGTPSTHSTLDLLAALNIPTSDVGDLRYRGEGWPGGFKVERKSGAVAPFIPYEEAWSRLEKKRPFRCHLCPDGLGRLADISCGDAWHRYRDDGDEGRSIILVRSERGRQLLHRAAQAGYVFLKPSGAKEVMAAQPNLLRRKRLLFGRLLAMRLLLIPTPRFVGFHLFRDWMKEPAGVRFRSVFGTLRRLIQRGLWRPRSRQSATARPVAHSAGPSVTQP